MKYFNGLQMGEGVAGPKTIGASTTVLYSCMGIAFVNRTTGIGGLYHYPAQTLNNPNVVETIRQMFNDIRPDEMVLTPAAVVMAVGSSDEDIAAMTKHLKTLNNNVTVVAGRHSAQLTWNGDDPVFNTHPDGEEPQAVIEQYRATMSSGRRQVEANIWYYGGDGEKEGVLEQGLAVAQPKQKGCCTIL